MPDQRDRADIASALTRKGFRCETKNRDHDYYFFVADSLTQAVFTKVSRGTEYRTIQESLLGKMSKQLRLTKQQFLELVDCDLDKEGYREILENAGFISKPKK